ncbi:MAG: flagellar cap protein FliD N-terminal domain-containing protein [Ilumatobacteraceae bacterium]
MSNSISFTAAGIDVSSIVSGFIAIDRQPIDRLTSRQSAVKLQSDAVGRLRNSFESLKTAAGGLLTSGLAKYSSSVSSSAVTATLSASAAAGSISFSVDQLARARGAHQQLGGEQLVGRHHGGLLALSTTSSSLGFGAATPILACRRGSTRSRSRRPPSAQ